MPGRSRARNDDRAVVQALLDHLPRLGFILLDLETAEIIGAEHVVVDQLEGLGHLRRGVLTGVLQPEPERARHRDRVAEQGEGSLFSPKTSPEWYGVEQ